jgi:hypothetical protein
MIRLSRKIHFNAGRSLWRPGWTAAIAPAGDGHATADRQPQLQLEVSVAGTDAQTGMVST